MSTEKITAELRTEFGKGAARRTRREGKIPAVIYGHGNDPIHVSLPGHDTMMAIKHGGANALLELDIDGTSQLALTKAVQVDAVRRVLEHVDFVAVVRGEKVTVDVPVVIVGEAANGTLVVTENTTVQVEAEATHIPEQFEVNLDGAEAGTQFLAGQLELPSGTTLLTDPETLVVNVTEQQAEEPAAESAEGDAEASAADAGEAAEGGDSE
jgi:large subunit ribosomal protein L25